MHTQPCICDLHNRFYYIILLQLKEITFKLNFNLIRTSKDQHIIMASKDSKGKWCCGKLSLKPLTKENLVKFYLPAQGFVTYTGLSVSVISPGFYTDVLPKKDMTNLLLLASVVGSGAYLYSRNHMEKLPQDKRVLYSGFGAVLFTFGSVLLWAIIRGALPDQSNAAAGVTLGIASSLGLTKLGMSYLEEIDKSVVKK
ncbi:uncharacterized protein LOC113378230 [Ctenocephalides felis]|uniref:uncharacterized protein LOC113378229 n=1 Tax=Ctenocephalides felis TaxID=7515 RepID=UPI000E6E2738|nr:uncharacterized protein LOC113378229 [Ctenocephalides felis]XP_026474545.1 uncharacterized protein LOC113378230 [Ctenocephalides felis]